MREIKKRLRWHKPGKPLIAVAVILSLATATLLFLPLHFRVEKSEIKEDKSPFAHRFVQDRLAVTFDESVTAWQAEKFAEARGYDVIAARFTDVVVKAELQEGWRESRITSIRDLPGVVNVRVVNWKKGSEGRRGETPVYGVCYVKSKKKELIFIHFENGTTAAAIRALCGRLGHLNVLEIQDSANDLVIACPREEMKKAVSLFEAYAEVEHVAFLTELVE